MALILEIRDPQGRAVLHRLNALPMTIGRALSNDAIIDDPYVDARHVRIDAAPDGAVEVLDLGTLNGLRENGLRVEGVRSVSPGSEFLVGRTVLRFRDAGETVAPALALEEIKPELPPAIAWQPPTIASRYEELLARITSSRKGRLSAVGVTVAAFSISEWLGNTDASAGSSVFAVALAVLGGTLIWSSIWAITGRGGNRRAHIPGHMAVLSLALLAVMAWNEINGWLAFIFPDAKVLPLLYVAELLTVLIALIIGSLFVANALTTQARWRAGVIVSGTFLALMVVAAALSDDEFSDVARFEGGLKPLSASLVPTTSMAGFAGDIPDLRDEVDKLAQKEPEP